jgi:hypothetical protein
MNIYYTSNIQSPDIVANSITIPNSQNGDLLFIKDKQIDGLAIGPNKYLVQSDGVQPQYTNTIDINTVKTNDIIINTAPQYSLLTIDAQNTVDLIPLGTPGNILTCTSTGFQTQPLVLPDPLTITNLNIAKPAGQLFLDNLGNVFSEKYQFFNVATQTVSANTVLFSHTFNTVPGRKYKYTSNFSQDSGLGNISLTVNGIGVVRTILNSASGNKNITYIFTGGAATVNIFLEYFTTTATTFGEILSLLEPLGY